jgi:hypothetical protein
MVRSRMITLIGLVVVALGTAQFVLGVALQTTEFGIALAGEFGWVLGNNHNYLMYNLLLMWLAWIGGGIVAGVGMVKSRSKFSRWV